MGAHAGFGLGLLCGLLAALLGACLVMASFISSDIQRFQDWLERQ